MRARNIKPGFFLNEDLSELLFRERLLYIGLWCCADRDGFFENRPKKLIAEIFPYDNIDIEYMLKMLQHLCNYNFITLNDKYGYIPKFLEHQKPHPHEAKSKVPEEIKISLINQCHDNVITSNDKEGQCKSDIRNPDIINDDIRNPKNEGYALSDVFEQFWKLYPKKVGKGQAEKAWKKIKKPTEMLHNIKVALDWQKKSEQWTKENGQYIPHPATYLNQRRWEDEKPILQDNIKQVCKYCKEEKSLMKFPDLCLECYMEGKR